MKKTFSMIIALLILIGCNAYALQPVYAENTLKVGDYVQFGSYLEKPILWCILNLDEDQDPLLHSEHILSVKSFDIIGQKHSNITEKLYGSNDWEFSEIRKWLNSSEQSVNWAIPPMSAMFNEYQKEKGFLADGNFTKGEREAIKKTKNRVILSEKNKHQKEGGNSLLSISMLDVAKNVAESIADAYANAYYKTVEDKVFFLFIEEIVKWYYEKGYNSSKTLTPEAITQMCGYFSLYSNTSFAKQGTAFEYWSRCPDINIVSNVRTLRFTDYATFHSGFPAFNQHSTSFKPVGVAPALTIDHNSIIVKSGHGTKDDPYILVAVTDSISEAEDSVQSPEAEPVEKPEELPVSDSSSQVIATPSASRVIVNGKPVSFDAYGIDGYTFFKLRDLAYVLNRTAKQFEVRWDQEKSAINLLSNNPYTPVGGELSSSSGMPANGILNTSRIYNNYQQVDLLAYTIQGNNYFKLRDIAKQFDFGVIWDEKEKTIRIDTSIGYEEDEPQRHFAVYDHGAGPENVDGVNVYPIYAIAPEDVADAPTNEQELEEVLVYMASNADLEYQFFYPGSLPGNFSEMVQHSFTKAFDKYPEYFSLFSAISMDVTYIDIGGLITLKLYNPGIEFEELDEMLKKLLSESDLIIRSLIREGKLKGGMSEKDKAEVLYRWVALNLKYDTSFHPESYTSYGAAINRKAVCQGYTGLYNLLCKKVGIAIEGVSGEIKPGPNSQGGSHMWSLAKLDGQKVYIDVTFGDPVPNREGYCNMEYFAVDSEFLSKTHLWKPE